MKRLLLLFLLALPIIGFSQCPPDGTFSSQAEIDAFAIDYPDCTILGVSLIISGDDITDLSGLGQIEACTGLGISNNLVLQNTDGLNSNLVLSYAGAAGSNFGVSDNAALIEITGLENLVNESGFESNFGISNNPMLISVAGVPNFFDSLSWFTISNNDSLINLNGLENYSAGEITTISNNDNLIDLTGLNSVTGSEFIRISDNDALESFNGLVYLGSEHNIIIENNAVLEDLNIATENIYGNSPELIIRNNQSLSVCNSNWVCYYLNLMGFEESNWFPGTFENNAPGCNSNMEVEYACGINSNDNCQYIDLSFPSNLLALGETITANNEFATTSPFTPSCNDIANRKDVWFAFDSGDLTTIDTFIQAGFYLQLWEGDCYELTSLENACGTQLIDIPVTPNSLYYIQVWNDDTTDRGGSAWFDLTVQDGALSTEDFQIDDVMIYPNPAQIELYIQSNSPIEKVEVYNLLGQQVMESNATTLNVSNLIDGLYLVKVVSHNKTATYKIVKQ